MPGSSLRPTTRGAGSSATSTTARSNGCSRCCCSCAERNAARRRDGDAGTGGRGARPGGEGASRAAQGIHPSALTERGLAAALRIAVARAPVSVELDVTDTPLDTNVAVAAYYIVSEALTNVAKYAEATRAAVRVRESDGRIVVVVEDDGKGGVDRSPARACRVSATAWRRWTARSTSRARPAAAHAYVPSSRCSSVSACASTSTPPRRSRRSRARRSRTSGLTLARPTATSSPPSSRPPTSPRRPGSSPPRRARALPLLRGARASLRRAWPCRARDRLLRPHGRLVDARRRLRVSAARRPDDRRRACRPTRVQRSSTCAGSARELGLHGRLLLRRPRVVGRGRVRPRPRGRDRLLRLADRQRGGPSAVERVERDRRARSSPSRPATTQSITADDNATFDARAHRCGCRARDRHLRRRTAQLLRPEAGGVRGRVRGRVAPHARVRRLARVDPRDRPGHDRHHVPRRRRRAAGARPRLPRAAAALPAAGLGRARPRGDLARASSARPRRRSQPPASAPPTCTRSGSRTSARRRCSGTAATGRPVGPAIVWQDRRTAARCRELDADLIRERTGLVPDPYFSATKLEWLPARAPAGRRARLRHRRRWLVWKLTGGEVHATDSTNASRTLLCSLATLDWDDELLELFGVDRSLLPRSCRSRGQSARPAARRARADRAASPATSRRRSSARPASARRGQGDVRHGQLRARARRRRRVAPPHGLLKTAALPTGMRARGRRVRQRRGSPVAARRARPDRRRRESEALARSVDVDRAASPSCPR